MDWIKGYLAGWTVAVIVAVISGWYATKGLVWAVTTMAKRMGYMWSAVVDGVVLAAIIVGSLVHAGVEHRRYKQASRETDTGKASQTIITREDLY